MNVLSLFDGMSCGQIALNRAGFKINKYYACEIDKWAIQVTQANYPNTQQLGDVTKVSVLDLPSLDLVIGGSPCQGFSSAGKRLNFEDPRSKLFFEFVRLLKEARVKNPNVKFLLENVKMKKEYQDVISEYLGVEPIEINSALVSAQNRVRFYWTNLEGVTQPDDRGLVLRDIFDVKNVNYDLSGYDHLLLKNEKDGFLEGERRIDYLRETLYSRKKNRGISYCAGLIEGDTPSGISRQIDRVYCIDYKGPCLTKFDNRIKLTDPESKKIYYLPHTGYEAKQTVPEGYTRSVSEAKGREMLGNGWTVDVIVHILQSDLSL